MKRMIALIITIALLCCGCGGGVNNIPPSAANDGFTPIITGNEYKGVWISYYEMNFGLISEEAFRDKITEMFRTAADYGLNAVFVHVRANSDAFYPSDIFPWAKQLTRSDGTAPDYDPMTIMTEIAHSLGLQFHAWLNPYRVCSGNTDPAALPDGSPAKLWMTDDNTDNDDWAVVADGGIYLNPGIAEVQRLILDGVREIAENYDIDGIHFDDYFYPTTDEEFDAPAYGRYLDSAGRGAMSLSDWRRTNVNSLVTGVYSIAKSHGKVFGISPAAAISTNKTDRNYTELYADIPLWMSSPGYVDYIAPQLYFGFDYIYESFKYDSLISAWTALPRLPSIKLYIGLAGYKIGTTDAGTDEWCERDDILMRQVDLAKSSGCNGFIVFSYGSLTNTDSLFVRQMENLRTVL